MTVNASVTKAFSSLTVFLSSWLGRAFWPFLEEGVRNGSKKLTGPAFAKVLNKINASPVMRDYLGKAIRGMAGIIDFTLPESMFASTQDWSNANRLLNDLFDEVGKGVGAAAVGDNGVTVPGLDSIDATEPVVFMVEGLGRRNDEEFHFGLINPETQKVTIPCLYVLEEWRRLKELVSKEISALRNPTDAQIEAIKAKHEPTIIPIPLTRALEMGQRRCHCLGEVPPAYNPAMEQKESLEIQIRDQIAQWQAVQAHLSHRGRLVEDEQIRAARDIVANDAGFMLRLGEALKGVNPATEDFDKDGVHHTFMGVADAPSDENQIAPSVMEVIDVFKDAGGTASKQSWAMQMLDDMFDRGSWKRWVHCR